ncbi:hypothetical protein GEMRC1_002014 [Eukaryota sp. GEM-RC1]
MTKTEHADSPQYLHEPNTHNPAFNRAFLTLTLSQMAEQDPIRFCALPSSELTPRFREIQQRYINEHMKWMACLILSHFKEQFSHRLPADSQSWHVLKTVDLSTSSPHAPSPLSLEDEVVKSLHGRRSRRSSIASASPNSVSLSVAPSPLANSEQMSDDSLFNPLVDPSNFDSTVHNSTFSDSFNDDLDFGLDSFL